MSSITVTLSSGVSYAPYGVLTVTESATSVANNTSTVTYSLVLKRPYNIDSTAPKTASCTINGTTYTWSGTIGGTGDKTLISGTQTVTHNSDGSKSISVSASITLQINWSGQWIDTISNSGTLTLTKLDRYPTSNQSLASKTETSITMNWSSNMVIDVIFYSINNGSSWTQVSIQNAKSGSYTISGLSANTTYNIKTRVKASASQLSTDSSSLAVKTNAYKYPSCSQSLSSKTETKMTIKWTSDTTISKVEYSTNGGTSYSTATTSANATSGSYTISGLSAGTSYSIRTRVTSKTSGLAAASSSSSQSTYSYPYANSMPNFKIGDTLTIGVYNPLNRSFTIKISYGTNREKEIADPYTGTKVSGFKTSSWVDWWYGCIPSATSGTYKVTITYGTHVDTKTGGTFSAVKANALPTAGTLSYVDTTSAMIAITGDSSKIVQNNSSVRYTVSGVAGNKSATISSVKVTVNGSTYTLSKSGSNYVGGNATINSGTNVAAKVTVTDSRGYTATTSKTVTMLAYANPAATIKLTRESNYYTPTTLRVSASCSNLNGGNSVTIRYRYAQSGGSYNSWTSINNNTNYTLQLDNTKTWNVQVQVTDTAGGTTTYTKVVQRGMPLMYWDTVKQSVGAGKFPTESNIFEASLKVKITGEATTPFLDFYRTDHDTSGRVYLINSENPAVVTGVKASDDDWVYVTRTQSYGFLPYTASGFSLGSNSYPWSRLYVDAVIENGTSLASKYAQKFGSDAEYTSLDDMTTTGFYYFTSSYTSVPVSAGGTVLVIRTSATYIHQLAFMNSSSTSSTRKPVIYARYLNATGWSNWAQITL